jgi:hypothetical protein
MDPAYVGLQGTGDGVRQGPHDSLTRADILESGEIRCKELVGLGDGEVHSNPVPGSSYGRRREIMGPKPRVDLSGCFH